MSETTVYRDKFAAVKIRKTGKKQYTIVKLRPGVVIVPITPSGRIVLVKQFRQALDSETLELPAGLKDKGGETVLQTAKRELLEETCRTAKTWVSLGRFAMFPNAIATRPFVVLALDATHSSQLKLEEEIKASEYSFEQIDELIRKKQLTDAVSISAIYAARLYLKKAG